MTTSKQPAVPEAFRDELQQSSQVKAALALLPKPSEAWLSAHATYRGRAWSYETSFSLHSVGDVARQREHVEELSARVGRVMPGVAARDLQTSLDAAKKNLTDLESLLANNPDEPSRIERAALRVANARRLQDLTQQMDAERLAKKPMDNALLDEREALEVTVTQDQAERAREVAAMTRASAEIVSARAGAITALVDALSEQIVDCAEEAAKILKPRLVLHLAYPQSIPGAAIACWRRAVEIANAALNLDAKAGFDVAATFRKASPRGWMALGQVVMGAGSRPEIEPEPVEAQQS